MAQKKRADLHAAIDLRLPDNTNYLITPADVRGVLHQVVDSALLPASDEVASGGYSRQEADELLAGKGGAQVQAQHTQQLEEMEAQLATIAVQGSAVYGYLSGSAEPVGYASLDEALADPHQKTFLRFNKAALLITKSNTGAGSFYINGEGATITVSPNVTYTLPGDTIGALSLERFYLEGGRGSKINLLTSAPATTPPALLPRLDGSFNCPVWLVNGGAVALRGSYGSLNGTGTVYVLEPFQCDNVAPGITLVRSEGGGASEAQLAKKADLDATGKVPESQLPAIVRLAMSFPPGGTAPREVPIVLADQPGRYAVVAAVNIASYDVYHLNIQGQATLVALGNEVFALGDTIRINATVPAGTVAGSITLQQL